MQVIRRPQECIAVTVLPVLMEPVPQIDLLASLAFAGQFCACAMLAPMKIPSVTIGTASQRIMLPPAQ